LRFLLFVEGQTEKYALRDFLKRWLDPKLGSRVGIDVILFEGCGPYYSEIAKRVNFILSGKPAADVIAAIGLVDLHGPEIYPQHLKEARERYIWAKEHLERKVDHPKFRQHFAVHETEAWVLSQPEILPPAVRKALPGKCSRPETVNFDQPPSKLLTRFYREKLKRRFSKTVDGANLFSALSPQSAYEKCLALKALLDDMLRLAQEALG
jgi:hypothetical protein